MKRSNPYDTKRVQASKRRKSRATATAYGFLPPMAVRSGALAQRNRSQGNVIIRGRPQLELKGVDNSLSAITWSADPGNLQTLVVNLIRPGTGPQDRSGRIITMQSLRIKGVVATTIGPEVTTLNRRGQTMRMVVVYDRQPAGTVARFDDVFGQTNQAGVESSATFDNVRYDNTARFKVLKEVVITTDAGVVPTGGTQNSEVRWNYIDEYIRLNDAQTNFSGQSSPCTIADIATGAIIIYFRAAESTTSTTSIWFSGSTRLRFKE